MTVTEARAAEWQARAEAAHLKQHLIPTLLPAGGGEPPLSALVHKVLAARYLASQPGYLWPCSSSPCSGEREGPRRNSRLNDVPEDCHELIHVERLANPRRNEVLSPGRQGIRAPRNQHHRSLSNHRLGQLEPSDDVSR